MTGRGTQWPKTERPGKKRDGWQLYNTYATIRVYRVINVSAKCH